MFTAFDIITRGLGAIQTLLKLRETVAQKEPLRKHILALYQALPELEKALRTYPDCQLRLIDGVDEYLLECDDLKTEPNYQAIRNATENCTKPLEKIEVIVEIFDPELHQRLREVRQVMMLIASIKKTPSREQIQLAWFLRDSISKARPNLRQFIAQNYSPKDFE
jgi:hypothetical protein